MTKPTAPKRLTITFNRARVKAGEIFEVQLPSSEEKGYVWTLCDKTGRIRESAASHAYPAWEPRARRFKLAASGTGALAFDIVLTKPGENRVKQRYSFKLNVK
jgi:predicted secreted protein